MKIKKTLFSIALLLLCAPAFAGWQNNGYYINDGYYNDNGSRLIVSVRGGVSLARAKIKNEMGSLYGYYYVNQSNGDVVSSLAWDAAGEPAGYLYAGYGDLSSLPAKKNFSGTAFTAGASAGFTMAKWILSNRRRKRVASNGNRRRKNE